MRQYAGFGTAKQTNERFRFLLAEGQTGLSVAFDLPTQMGYDSDHTLARGEVGRVGRGDLVPRRHGGAARRPAARARHHLDDDQCDRAPAARVLRRGGRRARRVARGTLGGTVQNDVLKEYIARGTYIYPPAPSLRLITDVFDFTAREVPQWNSISVSGYHMREAGATAVQELAFTLADGLTYLEAARARGLDPTRIARRMSFFFNAHNHLFEEVAKFRAARTLWAELLTERFGIEDREALKLRFHTQTAGSMLTAQQPLNNVVRTTVQGLAAVLGGTQSLHTNSYDEALGLPSREAALLALRTQQLLAHESGVDRRRRPARRLLPGRVAHRRAGAARAPADRAHRRDGRHARRRSSPAGCSGRSTSPPTAGTARSSRASAWWSASTASPRMTPRRCRRSSPMRASSARAPGRWRRGGRARAAAPCAEGARAARARRARQREPDAAHPHRAGRPRHAGRGVRRDAPRVRHPQAGASPVTTPDARTGAGGRRPVTGLAHIAIAVAPGRHAGRDPGRRPRRHARRGGVARRRRAARASSSISARSPSSCSSRARPTTQSRHSSRSAVRASTT